jgi:hypothetical protein
MKRITMRLTFILVFALLAGCSGTANPNTENPGSLERKPVETGEQQPSESEQPPSDNIEIDDEGQPEIKTDTGTYQGQIDSNFIEINISGIPEEKAARSFMLLDELKDTFGDLELMTGDAVRFWYVVNENEQNVILIVEKMDA